MGQKLAAMCDPTLGDKDKAPPATVVAPAWDNHFSAFGAQDVDKIMLDYTEESQIVVYNW